ELDSTARGLRRGNGGDLEVHVIATSDRGKQRLRVPGRTVGAHVVRADIPPTADAGTGCQRHGQCSVLHRPLTHARLKHVRVEPVAVLRRTALTGACAGAAGPDLQSEVRRARVVRVDAETNGLRLRSVVHHQRVARDDVERVRVDLAEDDGQVDPPEGGVALVINAGVTVGVGLRDLLGVRVVRRIRDGHETRGDQLARRTGYGRAALVHTGE